MPRPSPPTPLPGANQRRRAFANTYAEYYHVLASFLCFFFLSNTIFSAREYSAISSLDVQIYLLFYPRVDNSFVFLFSSFHIRSVLAEAHHTNKEVTSDHHGRSSSWSSVSSGGGDEEIGNTAGERQGKVLLEESCNTAGSSNEIAGGNGDDEFGEVGAPLNGGAGNEKLEQLLKASNSSSSSPVLLGSTRVARVLGAFGICTGLAVRLALLCSCGPTNSRLSSQRSRDYYA